MAFWFRAGVQIALLVLGGSLWTLRFTGAISTATLLVWTAPAAFIYSLLCTTRLRVLQAVLTLLVMGTLGLVFWPVVWFAHAVRGN